MRSIQSIAVFLIALPGIACGQSTDEGAAIKALPKTQVGADVIGTRLPLDALRWLNTEGNTPPTLEGRITLVRWWTDSCPFCATSLPAIAELEEAYSADGLQSIGVYHPKPPRAVDHESVLHAAKRIGYDGHIAVDEDWAVLRASYLDLGQRPATSVTFLLDASGTIRYIHPGPELRPGEGDGESALQAQYDEMREAIEALIDEEQSSTPE